MEGLLLNRFDGLLLSHATDSQTKELTLILELDNGVEEVLWNVISHLTGYGNVEDLDINLEKKTTNRDTLLHRIVYATEHHPEHMDLYMELVDMISVASVTWWYKLRELTPPQKKEDAQKYKYLAMTYLLADVLDSRHLSVWGLAVELQSVDILRKLVFLEDITCFRRQDNLVFILGESNFGSERKDLIYHLRDIIKMIKGVKGEDILRIGPLGKLAIKCSSTFQMFCRAILSLHIIFMAILSYAGCDLVDSTGPPSSHSTKTLLRVFGSMEVICLLGFAIIFLRASIDIIVTHHKLIRVSVYFFVAFMIILVEAVLLCYILIRADSEITTSDRYILSVSLLCGWIFTLLLAIFAFESVFIFCHMLVNIILQDVSKIILIYGIFLCGFSLAIHIQFISSPNITSTYKTPMHTMYLMFNVMMGMKEAVDEQTEEFLEDANTAPLFSKLLSIGYLLCCTIILINLLIAMMNKTYSRVRNYQTNNWLKYALIFRLSQRFKHKLDKTDKLQVLQDIGLNKSGWLITIPQKELNKEEDLLTVKSDIQKSVQQMKVHIQYTQREMLERIKDLQQEMSSSTQGNVQRQTVSSQTVISTPAKSNEIQGLPEQKKNCGEKETEERVVREAWPQ